MRGRNGGGFGSDIREIFREVWIDVVEVLREIVGRWWGSPYFLNN